MTDLMASGVLKLKNQLYVGKRKQIYDFYKNELKHLPLQFQKNDSYK